MSDLITVTGLVATVPRLIETSEGLKISSFRLASTQRRFDRGKNEWVDADTNWYTVSAFRQLAANVGSSVLKGERVVVTGRLKIRAWENGEKAGVTIEIEADAIGHDLAWGTASFARSIATATSQSREGGDAATERGGETSADGWPTTLPPTGGSPNADSPAQVAPELTVPF